MTSFADDPTNNGVKWSRNIILSNGEFALIVDNFDARIIISMIYYSTYRLLKQMFALPMES